MLLSQDAQNTHWRKIGGCANETTICSPVLFRLFKQRGRQALTIAGRSNETVSDYLYDPALAFLIGNPSVVKM